MSSARIRMVAVAVAVVAALAVTVGAAAAMLGRLHRAEQAQPGQPPSPSQGQVAADPDKQKPVWVPGRTKVLPPRHGAWLGAWVNPASNGQPEAYSAYGHVAALRDYERQLGRELDIVHTYHPWEHPFPSFVDLYALRRGSVLLLSWGGADTRLITSGRYDGMIRQRALAIKRLGKPLLMTWQHEMDRPDLQARIWSPADFIAAWRHIRSIFAAVGATNVDWVWCPTATAFQVGRAAAYYPGDDETDWICANPYVLEGPYQPMRKILAPFLAWARQRPKPIVLAEFGAYEHPARPGWLRGVADTVKANPQIKGIVYFDAVHQRRGRTIMLTLRGYPASLSAFADMLADPYFNPRRLRVRRP